jgi:hypothetical protein
MADPVEYRNPDSVEGMTRPRTPPPDAAPPPAAAPPPPPAAPLLDADGEEIPGLCHSDEDKEDDPPPPPPPAPAPAGAEQLKEAVPVLAGEAGQVIDPMIVAQRLWRTYLEADICCYLDMRCHSLLPNLESVRTDLLLFPSVLSLCMLGRLIPYRLLLC